MATLRALTIPLILAGLAAALYGAAVSICAMHRDAEKEEQKGHAFRFKTAVVFALTVSAILVASPRCKIWRERRVGSRRFGRFHRYAFRRDLRRFAGRIRQAASSDAWLPIVAGLSANTVSKMVVAAIAGGRAFALRIIPGLILVVAAAWAGC